MSRLGSRMSNEDVTEWPELKGIPLKDQQTTARIEEMDSQMKANDTKSTSTIDELSRILVALISELRKKGVIE